MRAAQPLSGHFLPKQYFGNRTLQPCTTRGKGDNIVLIEVDSDDFGNVIILDVPESLQEKFRKNQEHPIISIDDDDDGDEVRAQQRDMANDATTSDKFPSASAVDSSNCAKTEDCSQFVGGGSNPVKLSKSKRTYSGKGISRHRYGLGPDTESCSSGSDDSDCELMEDSSGKLREEWERASFRRRYDSNCGHSDAEDYAGPSTSHLPVYNCSEEGTTEHLNPTDSHCNVSSLNHDYDDRNSAEKHSQEECNVKEMDEIFMEKHGSCDSGNNSGSRKFDQSSYYNTEPSIVEHSELPPDTCCFKSSPFNNETNSTSFNFAERLAQQVVADGSDDVTKGETICVVERDYPACGEQNAEKPIEEANESGDSLYAEAKSSDYNCLITDRQKIKETDEYKRAMEEELASRQQELLRQAGEAQRLRNRKRAENIRITANQRRQKLRLEEVRETRRKDEENLNLKDQLRSEIRNELRKLETMCVDMASLLRALGIQVNGGLYPSPNEVQAAYKRACLKFHPDRLSVMDVRQQVEAEEKFKLISNMKDKLW